MNTTRLLFLTSARDALLPVDVTHVTPMSEADILSAATEAVTHWVKFDPAGQAAYEHNSDEFNIGDLSEWLFSPMLSSALEQRGLAISFGERISLSQAHNFDLTLVDHDAVDSARLPPDEQ